MAKNNIIGHYVFNQIISNLGKMDVEQVFEVTFMTYFSVFTQKQKEKLYKHFDQVKTDYLNGNVSLEKENRNIDQMLIDLENKGGLSCFNDSSRKKAKNYPELKLREILDKIKHK